jgi:ABC-type cobalamin transport system ATPase subunit
LALVAIAINLINLMKINWCLCAARPLDGALTPHSAIDVNCRFDALLKSSCGMHLLAVIAGHEWNRWLRSAPQSRKSILLNGGVDRAGNRSAFINVNLYKSTFTKLKSMVIIYRSINEVTYFISEESDHERHIHII